MTTKKKPAATKTSAAVKTAAPRAAEAATPAADQLAAFQEGIRLFAAKDFAGARGAFQNTAKGPAANITDKARSYLHICERKLAGANLLLKTSEDYFNVGVERLNARDIEEARRHLGRAASMSPDAEHILYTFALSCGLDGDGGAACENLKRAIELDPRNRILARQDPDFISLATQYPSLRTLME